MSADELEVLNGRVARFGYQEEARIVRFACDRKIEDRAVGIDAVEGEGLVEGERTVFEDESRAVKPRIKDDGVRFARNATNESATRLVGIGFSVPDNFGTRGNLDAGLILRTIDELAVLVDDLVTVGESDARAFFEDVLRAGGIDVGIGDKDESLTVDDDFVAVVRRIDGGFRDDKTILGVVVDGGFAIGEGYDVAVADDRDVVRSNATEDAVDDGNFRAVFKGEDAHALDIVARVAMRNFRMNPLAVDHFVLDAAKGRRRAVRDRRQLPFGIVVDVLNVGRVDAYVEIP